MSTSSQHTRQHNKLQPPQHGGNLDDAIRRYGIEREQWLDLSSGVSPWAWPIPSLPQHVWTNLPSSTDELLKSATRYLSCDDQSIVASPGSQLLIRLIPQQLKSSNVAIPALGYQEHQHSWQLAGHTIHYYQSFDELHSLIDSKQVEHALVINPNNPTGETILADEVSRLAQKTPGLLIVDEAFMDLYQFDGSQAEQTIQSAIKRPHDNQIVLRSVGKFFGLAGLRVGFAVGTHPIINKLTSILEPWSLNHASQYLATQMLKDTVWQQAQTIKVKNESQHFENIIRGFAQIVLTDFHLSNGGLFITLFANKEALKQTHITLAQHSILTRLHNPNDHHAWLRFSLTQQPMKCQSIFEQIINDKHQKI